MFVDVRRCSYMPIGGCWCSSTIDLLNPRVRPTPDVSPCTRWGGQSLRSRSGRLGQRPLPRMYLGEIPDQSELRLHELQCKASSGEPMLPHLNKCGMRSCCFVNLYSPPNRRGVSLDRTDLWYHLSHDSPLREHGAAEGSEPRFRSLGCLRLTLRGSLTHDSRKALAFL